MKVKTANFLCLIFGSLLPISSPAVLGEKADSIQDVNKALKSKAEISKQTKVLENGEKLSWTVHIMKTKGSTVREYVSPEGKVFAVSWSGAREPDLKMLLGSYYKEYFQSEKMQPIPKGQKVKSIESKNLKTRESGFMRDRTAQVVVKDLIPEGLQTQEIQ